VDAVCRLAKHAQLPDLYEGTLRSDVVHVRVFCCWWWCRCFILFESDAEPLSSSSSSVFFFLSFFLGIAFSFALFSRDQEDIPLALGLARLSPMEANFCGAMSEMHSKTFPGNFSVAISSLLEGMLRMNRFLLFLSSSFLYLQFVYLIHFTSSLHSVLL
jgi:hypothetical protein